MANLVKYGSYSLEAAEEEEADLESSGGGADFMKLAEGKNVVRFMPPPLGLNSPFKVVSQHYVKNPTGSPVVFACPRVMEKRFCPVCNKANSYKASGNAADKKAAGELYAKRRIFANVIDRSDPDSGPKILAFGKMIQQALVKIRKNEDIGGDYTDPTDGFDIIIERTGQGLNTSYSVLPARRESPLGDMEWIGQQHDLQRYAEVPTDEELQEMLAEIGGAPSGGGGGRRSSGGGSRKSSNKSAFDDAIDADGEDSSSSSWA